MVLWYYGIMVLSAFEFPRWLLTPKKKRVGMYVGKVACLRYIKEALR